MRKPFFQSILPALVYLVWLCALPLHSHAQRVDWQWAIDAKSPTGQNGSAMAKATSTDAAGNAAVTGYYYGRVTFGASTLDNGGSWQTGPYSLFVARLDADGHWLWATDAHSVSPDGSASGCAVALDPVSGETYVTGYFAHTTTFGDTTLSANAQGLGFVARLDAAGRWRWVRVAGTAGTDANARALCLDPATGDALLTGLADQATTFGATHLPSNGFQLFVARITAAGQWRWATAGGSGPYPSTLPWGVAVGPDGTVAVGGAYAGRGVFGADTIRASANPRAGFVATLNGADGTWRWARNAAYQATGVAVEAEGEVMVTGIYGTEWPLIGDSLLPVAGRQFFSGPYVARLSRQGHTRWVSHLTGQTDRVTPQQLALEQGTGQVVVIGLYTGDTVVVAGQHLPPTINPNLFVARLSPTGRWLGVSTGGGRDNNVAGPAGSVSPGADHVTVAGLYGNRLEIGSLLLTVDAPTPGYNPAMFVARLSLGLSPWGALAVLPNLVAAADAQGVRVIRPGTPTTDAATAEVFDAIGRRVLAMPFPAGATGITLPTASLSAGLYVVRASGVFGRLVVW